MQDSFSIWVESLQESLKYLWEMPAESKFAIILFGFAIWIVVKLSKSLYRRWAMRHRPALTFTVPERVYSLDHEIRLTKNRIAELGRSEGEQVVVSGSQGRKRLRIVSRNQSTIFNDNNVDLSKATFSKLSRKGSAGEQVHLEIKDVVGFPFDSLLNHPNLTTRMGFRLSFLLFLFEVILEFRTDLVRFLL